MVEYKKNKKPFTIFQNLNLLNTTTMNTRYGIVDRILPYSTYYVQINATNSKGYLLSNQVKVETFKSIPEGIIPPSQISSTSNSMQIEWYDPILPNSADQIFYFQVNYRQKNLWNSNGSFKFIEFLPIKKIKTIQFLSGTITISFRYHLTTNHFQHSSLQKQYQNSISSII